MISYQGGFLQLFLQKEKKATNYCIRLGNSLWSASQLPAQVVKWQNNRSHQSRIYQTRFLPVFVFLDEISISLNKSSIVIFASHVASYSSKIRTVTDIRILFNKESLAQLRNTSRRAGRFSTWRERPPNVFLGYIRLDDRPVCLNASATVERMQAAASSSHFSSCLLIVGACAGIPKASAREILFPRRSVDR